jgi:flagellar biosynthetic protein FlhB
MADEDLDRNDAATPHKLDEARKRGQVAKSSDVVSAVVFLTAAAYLSASSWELLKAQFHLDHALLAALAHGVDGPVLLWQRVDHAVRATAFLLLPLLCAILAAAIVGNLAQIGFVLSTHPLKPDWQRINPATGFKRLVSMRTLFDTGRTCLKFLLLSLVVVMTLTDLFPRLQQLSGRTPLAILSVLGDSASSLGLKLALAMVAIALIDLVYTRREFAKKMRMSRRELKDEVKHREGDPRIRARLRELRREMVKRSRSLGKTRDADILITNPTHVAVALRYRHGDMDAPQLIGKGVGAMAATMRAIAARHRIPVVQNPRLARALYAALDVDQHVPADFYADLAPLMVWMLTLRKARDNATGVPA